MFVSPTYGKLSIEQVPDYLLSFYNSNKEYNSDFAIVVGSDSQNFDYTKAVTVISIICKGHGGIFFYKKKKLPLVRDIRTKLYTETQDSLTTTGKLIDILESDDKYLEMYESCPISIHVDAGNSDKSKSAELVPEIVGWVHALGYDCHIKPDSFVASSVADRISK